MRSGESRRQMHLAAFEEVNPRPDVALALDARFNHKPGPAHLLDGFGVFVIGIDDGSIGVIGVPRQIADTPD